MTTVHVTIDDCTTTISVVDITTTGDAIAWAVPCGAASLHQHHFTADPPCPEDLTNAIGEMTDHLDDAIRELPMLSGPATFVVAGAAARAMACVEYGGRIQAPEFELTRDAAEDVFRTLATESLADRRHNPGLPAELAETIVGGCCAMVALLRTLQLDTVTVIMEGPA